MGTYKIYQYDDADMTRNANIVMEVLEARLYADGLIPESDTLSKRYVVQLVRKGKVSAFLDDLMFKNEEGDAAKFKVFKLDNQ